MATLDSCADKMQLIETFIHVDLIVSVQSHIFLSFVDADCQLFNVLSSVMRKVNNSSCYSSKQH